MKLFEEKRGDTWTIGEGGGGGVWSPPEQKRTMETKVMKRSVYACLPELPTEVEQLIWEWVRSDLRPRMKRRGPLLSHIRFTATCKILQIHGAWMFTCYRHVYGPVEPNYIVLAVCIILGLRDLAFSVNRIGEEGSHHAIPLTMVNDATLPPTILARANLLWKCMPNAEWKTCEEYGHSYYTLGRPVSHLP